ncbi:unnamed protein product [Mytilus edulis]|uniref:Uncharacterized protein n=1 Tax=Mytilus edulis TaxID=6550 RepID=A0A8S3VCW5_MYTED|nr:unnamed protein product [Mytilus edulis]
MPCKTRPYKTGFKLQEAYAYEGPALGLNRRTSGPKYRPGKSNADADALSRLPITSDSIQAICNVAMPDSYIDSLTLTSDAVLKDLDLRGSGIGNIVDWRKVQEQDPDIQRIVDDTPEPSPIPKPKPRPRKRPAKRTEELGTIQPDSKQESDEESEWNLRIITKTGMVSDSSITEENIRSNDDEDILVTSETEGDAQSSVGTIGIPDDVELVQEGSASNNETVQEEPPDEETAQDTDTDEDDEPVQLRRSTRERRVPLRFRSGDFDMTKSAQRTPLSDWEKKVQYITSLSDRGYMEGLQSEAAKTILDILKSSSHTPT